MAFEFIDLAQLHILVDDIDEASEFYRNVFGMIEMQSHRNIVNAGLAEYYGHSGDPEDFRLSLRFMFIPDVVTLKLIKLENSDYSSSASLSSNKSYSKMSNGLAAISVVVDDLEAAYEDLVAKARDYSEDSQIKLLSPPTFMSPLQPHEIATTPSSVLHGRDDILEEYLKTWPFRAKFQLIDPFGVRWEINNDVDGFED